MRSYKDTPALLLALFPEFAHEPTYDEADKAIPYVFLANFIPYLRDLWSAGRLSRDDERLQKMFAHINELEQTRMPENTDFVGAGLFESMIHGEPSDKIFEEAAKVYLTPDLFDQFRFIKSGRAGTLQDFLTWEKQQTA